MTISIATENYTLTSTGFFDFKFNNLVNSSSILASKGDLVFPKLQRVELEVICVLSLECFYGWIHLSSELE